MRFWTKWNRYNMKLTYFLLIWGTVIQLSKINVLNSFVVLFMAQHFGIYIGNECSKICIAWRNVLKVIWNLPYATHKRILSLLCGSAPLHVQLKARFVKFRYKALNHNNSVIKSVTKYACNNSMSVCCRNWSEFVCE